MKDLKNYSLNELLDLLVSYGGSVSPDDDCIPDFISNKIWEVKEEIKNRFINAAYS